MEIGPPEILIVLVVVVLLFGPGRIASVGRELGESIRQFRKGLDTPHEANTTEKEE